MPALILVVAALALSTPAARADDGPVAVARLVTGAATMTPRDNVPPMVIRTGTRIPSGWTVFAMEGTLLDLTLPDSHIVRLGPEPTAVRWQQGRLQTVTITVHAGNTAHRIQRLGENASYRVVTPTVVSGVRGTRFIVQVGENGAARTAVDEGSVAIGEGSPERELEAGDEHKAWMGEEGPDPDTAWLRAQIVLDSRTAGPIASEAGERMTLTNEMTRQDYAEMALLTEQAMRFVLNQPRTPEQIEHAANVLARSLRLYQRMTTRSELMEARITLARVLNARFRVSAETAEKEYAAFSQEKSSQGEGLETFISRLELLVKVLRTANTAAAAAGAVTGGGLRIPSIPGGWFGR